MSEDGFTPSWRRLYLDEFVPDPDMCWNCGLEVRERYRRTTADRRLNSGVWHHVETECRSCDPDSPKGYRGPQALPKR